MDLGPVITSKSNARVKELRASLSGKASAPGELLGLEGEHLLVEAERSGCALDTVYLREGSQSMLEHRGLKALRAKSRVVLSVEVFASAVDTASPQGVAATWPIQEPDTPKEVHGVALVLEGLQDPGNLGTLIRSAEAFGVALIMVTPETVSQWNPKVVRASAGSVFRMPVMRLPLEQVGERVKALGLEPIAAVSTQSDAVAPYQARIASECALMIGNEGAGLSSEALAMAKQRIRIPCAVESLNAAVAGSTLMYESMRQRLARESTAKREAV